MKRAKTVGKARFEDKQNQKRYMDLAWLIAEIDSVIERDMHLDYEVLVERVGTLLDERLALLLSVKGEMVGPSLVGGAK